MGKFSRLAVLGNIASMNNGIGFGIKAVDISYARAKVLCPRVKHRVGCVGSYKVGVGDLGDDHDPKSDLPVLIAGSSGANDVTEISQKMSLCDQHSEGEPYQSASIIARKNLTVSKGCVPDPI